MTIKTLLFCLFLYVAGVWVGAAYLRPRDFQQFGLRWTFLGLVALLTLVIGARLVGLLRFLRAKAAVKPRPQMPAKPVPAVHEDDAALAAMLAEASATLAKAPGYVAKRGRSPLSGLPLYLLVGPEGSGKTSTLVNSGLEPQPLTGQTPATGEVAPTRLCNIWLAKDAVFVEFAGRVFAGEANRWIQLLGQLKGKKPVPLWRRLWSEPEQGLALRGVVGFCGISEFSEGSSIQALEKLSDHWRQRLQSISEVFGVEFPIYQLVTHCDAIRYFPDFFRRVPEPEATQVLGCTLPFTDRTEPGGSEAPPAEAAKRLTRSFRALFHALAGRRLLHLAHEPDPARRPAIYEFPRELKRVWPSLLHFLQETFRAHPLRHGPLLRGYYFTGIREVEEAAADPATSHPGWPGTSAIGEATQLFRGDVTQLFRPGEHGPIREPSGRSRTARRWVFTSDLFHQVILADRGRPQKQAPADPRLELYRRVACGGVCAICALWCVLFVWSWAGNRVLLDDVARAGQTGGRGPLAEMQSMDALREQVARLLKYDRDGAPLWLRWGLYAGDGLTTAARNAYFRRFQHLLLNQLNGEMVARLGTLPSTPAAGDPYDPTYRMLKTHLIISSGTCQPDPALVSSVLKEMRQRTEPSAGSEWQRLADRQIDFYAGELSYGRPCRITENIPARDRARQYLRNVKGIDRIYQAILASVEKALPKPPQLVVLAPNYAQVLAGPGEFSAAFTPDGWKLVAKASKERSSTEVGEACVVAGEAGSGGEAGKQDQQIERAIQNSYVREYIDRWQKFVEGFSVIRYTSAADAARKLELLADRKSPLLALFALTANQTSFPAVAAEQGGEAALKVPLIGPVLKKVQQAGEKALPPAETETGETGASPANITRSFQPVHLVVPPASDIWVTEKNAAYMGSLSLLGRSMREIADSRGNVDPAVYQAASQNYNKAVDAASELARGFKSVGVGGVDGVVQRLLEQPIEFAKTFITDPDVARTGKLGRDLQQLCTQLRSTLRKYPFQPAGEDASLEEIATMFGPSGAIWKFQAQALSELTMKEGGQWKPKDPAKKPQVTAELLNFLTRAQSITDAFYPQGATQLQLVYTLRPRLDESFKDWLLELEIDGRVHQWATRLQKQFTWPSPSGTKDLGAVARIRAGGLILPVASRGGLWGIFRIIGQDAEPRPLSGKLVEWKYLRGGDGRREPISPAPVRVEIVEFPGGADVFNPKFFAGLGCPARAVQ